MFKLSKFFDFKRSNLLYLIISVAIILWCVSIGWAFNQALGADPSPRLAQSLRPDRSTVEAGKEMYVSTCSGCHIPIPPEVLPTETWQELLENPQKHYGGFLKVLARFL